ncbi:MAG: hypothetical protein FJW31_14980 [Acidobacteria bacterium]|nr:hypothetical protein [Acidobacteriota bacterium]
MGLAPAARAAVPTIEIDVGSRRQLLFDDFLVALGSAGIEDYPFNIRWSLGKVRKDPYRNLLIADQPSETSTAWLSALYDGGKYRLWYNAGHPSKKGLFVSYAESDDGLTWRKPTLNQIDVNGSKSNNVVFAGGPSIGGLELGNVFIDPIAPPEERYKMFYPVWDTDHVYPNHGLPFLAEAGVMRGAFSPDGIGWTRYQQIFLGSYMDSQNVAVYDPELRKYVAYIRYKNAKYGALDAGEHTVVAARRGRAIGRMESDDFKSWTYPELAIAPDFQDGFNVELYNQPYSRYPSADHAHFMFPSAYHKREGTFHVNVAVSRANKTWFRPTRETYVPLGEPGSMDDFIISVAPGFLPAGRDQLALYYRSGNGPHSGALRSVKARVPKTVSGMGRIVFPRERIVGIEAGAEEGTFATRPLLFSGQRLVVNAEPTGPDPRLRAQIVSVGARSTESAARGKYKEDAVLPGLSFDDSVPITADGLDSAVRWSRGANLGEWAGKPVRIHVRFQSMRIYAFQFAEAVKVKWYRKAADKGYASAQSNLGVVEGI